MRFAGWSNGYDVRFWPGKWWVQFLPPQFAEAIRASCEHMFVDALPVADSASLCWLAGLLEGEGSFMSGPPSRPGLPIIAVHMTDEDVMRRVGAMLGRSPVRVEPRRPNWAPSWLVRLSGHRAVVWMRLLRPLMGARRRAQIDAALASYAPKDSAKLTPAMAEQGLRALAGGATVRDVAERFGVSVWCIYDLRAGRTHKRLPRAGGSAEA